MNKNIKLQKRDAVYYKTKNGDNRTVFIDLSSGQSIKDYERDNCFIITKVERPQTIYEVKEILDKKEREYLSKIIEPFKNRVKRIEKVKAIYCNSEFIEIVLYSSISYDREEPIQLPCFKKGTMYKGMELNKQYSLKELGLD